MKVQNVSFSNPSFFGSRVKFDVQGHIGTMYDNLHGQTQQYTRENILDTVEINNVKKILVSSVSGLNSQDSSLFESEYNCACRMEKLCGNERVKFYPLISCQPGISKSTSVIEQFLLDDTFVGMKFHPTNTNKPIKDNFDIYSKYLALAEEKGLPCVFHSTTDGKSDPVEIIRLAEAHPKLPVVLYHIDLMASSEQMTRTIDNIANSIKAGKSNLFVDISWLTGLFDNAGENRDIIKLALEKIGSERILFGSDTPITEMGDKEKYGKFADFVEETVKEFYKDKPDEAERALNNIFYDNAEELFIEKKWNKKPVKNNKLPVKKGTSGLHISKSGLCLAAGIAMIALAGYTAKLLLNDNRKS